MVQRVGTPCQKWCLNTGLGNLTRSAYENSIQAFGFQNTGLILSATDVSKTITPVTTGNNVRIWLYCRSSPWFMLDKTFGTDPWCLQYPGLPSPSSRSPAENGKRF